MRELHEGVWAVEQSEHFMPGGIHMPLRMTVVRLPSGGLWLHSPVPLDDACAAAIEALGEVEHLVVPSRMHDLHAAAAQARWPGARLWAPAGLAADHPEWRVDETLVDGAGWEGVLSAVAIDGATGRPAACWGRCSRLHLPRARL